MSRNHHRNSSPVFRLILAGLAVIGGMILLLLFPSLRAGLGKKKESAEGGEPEQPEEDGESPEEDMSVQDHPAQDDPEQDNPAQREAQQDASAQSDSEEDS